MRKLFVILVAIAFFATPVFALVETANNGPQNVTACWIKGAQTVPVGGLVCLVTGNSVTYPGREVTATDSDLGLTQIYGINVGETVTSSTAAMTGGTSILVQTHGYVSQVNLDAGSSGILLNQRAGQVLNASGTPAEGSVGATAYTNATTGNVATFGVPDSGGGTTSAWLYGI